MAVLNKLVTKLAKPVVDTVEEFLKTFNKKVYHGTQGSDVSGAFKHAHYLTVLSPAFSPAFTRSL